MKQLRYPGCVIDLSARSVVRGDERSSLTGREVELLTYLSARAGQVVSRKALEREVWGYKAGVRSEAVPVAIRRLRDKIEADSASPVLLTTVKNEGYLFQRPVVAKKKSLRRYHTPWIARQSLMDAVDAGLMDFRVVTLLGPGGAGKTRLATEVLQGSDRSAVMVDLCRIEDATGVLQQLLADTGFDGKNLEEVSQNLDARVDVVLIDNAEHVLDQVAELVEELVGLTERVQFLVTSRAPLNLPFERVVEIGPMDAADAQALFRAHFSQADADRTTVGKLVEMVDRLPLAIELVARQRMPLGALVGRVAAGEAMKVNRRGAQPRETSIEGAIRWSWDLLDDEAKEVLQICALWPGTAPLEGVEAVAGRDVSISLHRLVDCSMLQRGLGTVHLLQLVSRFVRGFELSRPTRERWRAWVLAACERDCDLRLCSPELETAYLALTDVLALIADDPEAPTDDRGRALLLLSKVFLNDRHTQVWRPKLLAICDQLAVPLQHNVRVLECVWDFFASRWDRLAHLDGVDVSQATPVARLRFLHLSAVVEWRASRPEEALTLLEEGMALEGVQETPRAYLVLGVKSQVLRDLHRAEEGIRLLEAASTELKARGWTTLAYTLDSIQVDMLGSSGRVQEAITLGEALLEQPPCNIIGYQHENLVLATATALLEVDPELALEILLDSKALLVEQVHWLPRSSPVLLLEMVVRFMLGDLEASLLVYAQYTDGGHNPTFVNLSEAFALAARAALTGELNTLRVLDPIALAQGLTGAGPELDGPALLQRLEAMVLRLRGEPCPELPPLHPNAAQIVRGLQYRLENFG